jgi:hypothetical protein
MSQRIRSIAKIPDAGVMPATENGRLTGMVTDRNRAIRVARATPKADDTKTGQVVQAISE